ncbi:MAG: hypothetical protein HY815_03885 [Candidatus Riflebacteria bacterium]|nr:hypothetical protein [Candidatus Riflebacteria bacterium]
MPNIMVLQYLKKTGAASPEVLMKAEAFVRQGYQRLLTFEAKGGGFSWFGESPANVMLTAYGLVEFAEMAKVIPIDDKLLERTRRWLVSRRLPDGRFEESRSPHSLHVGDQQYALTAFVTWALLSAGASATEVAPSMAYLMDNLDGQGDPYSLSLVLDALTLVPARRNDALRLARRLVGEKKARGWAPRGTTLVNSRGSPGQVETTALVVLGLAALQTEPLAIRDGVQELMKAKNADGRWFTTTATVLALKALLADQNRQPTREPYTGTVKVSVNGRPAGEVAVSEKTYDVMQLIDLKEFTRTGDHTVSIRADLTRPQLFSTQIVATYYVPWDLPAGPLAPTTGTLNVRQTFDRTSLVVDDRVTAKVTLELTGQASGSLVLLDLGIPPGFAVETQDLEALRTAGTISRFELAGRQLVLYLPPLQERRPISFEYRLKARFPVRASSPPSTAYEYYNPDNRVQIAPVPLEVK